MVVEPSRPITGALAPRTASTVIFVGHARLPQSLAPREASPVISVEVEVNLSSGEIVSSAVRAVPELAGRLVAGLLQGRNINDSPVEVMDAIRRRYVCPSQKALSTAVLNAFEAYTRYRQVGIG
ncbi:MAG TPA: DUF3870 domain-containing protein [Dehalococcoidia bacterium]|nr:DUF3870 domain-containing protein [Dehalococcoidia bacterium]